MNQVISSNIQFNYALCGMYTHYNIIQIIFEIKKIFPEYFYNNFGIDAIYGNFQFCIWEGGRIFPTYKQASIQQVQEIQHYYNNILNIPIRFIYTNSKIEKKHLYNKFCNLVTEYCENDLNEIVVNSPLLEDYLRNKYPKYKFISSTTKCILDQEKTKELLNNNKYSLVCLDYNLNYNFNFLNSLTQEQKNKCEFLINSICKAQCPMRKHHYELISEYYINPSLNYNFNFCNGISFNSINNYKENNNITYEDITNIYFPLGFKHFKIEGRTFPTEGYVKTCLKYMVKPEYHNFIYNEIIKNIKIKEDNKK